MHRKTTFVRVHADMLAFLLFVLLNITPIYSSIQIIKVRENASVSIICDFSKIKSKLTSNEVSFVSSLGLDNNLSDNIILWYKDETQVIGVNSISNDPEKYSINQTNFHTYQLTIHNVRLESSGLYKCQNFTAKEENRFQLNVLAPPSHLHLISSVPMPAADGTLVAFNCTSERVYPNPTFEWYRNDKLIQRSIGNQTSSAFFSSSSILTLLLTPADHNHMLRCHVSNEASDQGKRIEMKLDVLYKPIVKIFYEDKELKQTWNVMEHRNEMIHCRISSNPRLISNVEWFKNDQLIPGENQEQLQINTTDIKSLSCRARNIIGQTETRVHVNVLYKPKLSMIDNITLNRDESLLLTCTINANPQCHQIRWFHNYKEIFTQTCTQKHVLEYRINNVNRSHAGKYTCDVRNWLNTTHDKPYEGISTASTQVYVQYAPFILNSYNKLAVKENSNITTRCVVDAYPKAEITWFEPSGKALNSYTREEQHNGTFSSAELHLPPSYSSKLGRYRCLARNSFGQHEFFVEFQRPGLPDPPSQLEAVNITHSSFIVRWQSGYDGGSDQTFHITLNGTHSQLRDTKLTWCQYGDLNEDTQYIIRIRSQNAIGYSDYTTNFVIRTEKFPKELEQLPKIHSAYYSQSDRRIRFQTNEEGSIPSSPEQYCIRIQYSSSGERPGCIQFSSIPPDSGIKVEQHEQHNLRLKVCLYNDTNQCSRPIPVSTRRTVIDQSSNIALILIGGVLGLGGVFGLIILFICIHHCVHQRKYKQKSKTGSTDTLKTNSDNIPTTTAVRVSDTNSCLYYPTNESRTLYFNDETIGIYSIQEKKNSPLCFDSGMPSTTSNNSDSAGSQALSSLDSYDRSDGEFLVNGPASMNKILLSHISMYATAPGKDTSIKTNAMTGRISSEDESDFSTLSKSQNGKKLIYEVVV